MKHVVIMLACLSLQGYVFAQQKVSKTHQDKIKTLSAWVGTWQGEGSMMTPTGEKRTSSVKEVIEYKLDSTLLLIEGIGRYKDAANKEVKAHHALAVLFFDAQANEYKFKSFLFDGKTTDAWFKPTGENTYQWGFDTPRGKLKYSITIDVNKKTWNETGEYSTDGNSWNKFFEMNLTKL